MLLWRMDANNRHRLVEFWFEWQWLSFAVFIHRETVCKSQNDVFPKAQLDCFNAMSFMNSPIPNCQPFTHLIYHSITGEMHNIKTNSTHLEHFIGPEDFNFAGGVFCTYLIFQRKSSNFHFHFYSHSVKFSFQIGINKIFLTLFSNFLLHFHGH
jgi:hypothetical protein